MKIACIVVILTLLILVIVSCNSYPPTQALDLTSTPLTSATGTLPEEPISTFAPYQSCLLVANQTFDDANIVGTIVLYRASPDSSLFLLDIDTNELRQVSQENGEGIQCCSFSESPDRTRVAYLYRNIAASQEESATTELRAITSDGTVSLVASSENNWTDLLWLDDDHILIKELSDENSSGSIVSLNPDTGELTYLQEEFPDLWYLDRLQWGFYSSNRAAYNPGLTRVAYPVFGENRPIRLINLQTGETVADIPTADYGRGITWSPDGRNFAFISSSPNSNSPHDEIVVVSEDGQASQITNFSESYDDVAIMSLSWSPDGQRIAFWVSTNSALGFSDSHLMVVDVATREAHDFCGLAGYRLFYHPVWSPNSDYYLFGLMESDVNGWEEFLSEILLVNMNSGELYLIAKDYLPFGWLVR